MSDSDHPRPQTLLQAVPDAPKLICFQALNAISFQIALGPPLVLMARHWGASSVYIGLITSLVPLLSMLAIYMAPRIEYIGYRKVVLSGWTGRNLALILTTLLPFVAHWLPKLVLLEALFVFMFIYNSLRGMASSSWMPWMTHLVPLDWRGRFVSIDQLVINLFSAVAFVFCGKILGDNPGDLQFGILWIVALASGWSSLYFLKSINSPPPKTGKPNIEPFMTWARRVWGDRTTRRLIRMNLMWSMAIAAWGTFTVVFLRDRLHLSDRIILYITAMSTLGGVVSAWVWGILADRFGSRPVMSLSTRVVLVVMICWVLLSLELWPPHAGLITVLYVILGMGLIGFNVGNARYLYNNAPPAFPVLALTLFSVLTSLANGVAPIAWGLFLGVLEKAEIHIGWFTYTNFTWFYLATIAVLIACKMLIRKLPDDSSAATHVVIYHILNDLPLRAYGLVYHALFGREEIGEVFEQRKRRRVK